MRLLTLPFRLLHYSDRPFLLAFGVLPFLVYLYVGMLCTKYDVAVLLHHSIPTWAAAVIALILGGFTIVSAIVVKVLVMAGAIAGVIL